MNILKNITGVLNVSGLVSCLDNAVVYGTIHNPFAIERTVNTNTYGCGVDFRLLNSASESTRYGKIGAVIEDNTDGAEDGRLSFETILAGTVAERMSISSAGLVSCLAGLSVTGGIAITAHQDVTLTAASTDVTPTCGAIEVTNTDEDSPTIVLKAGSLLENTFLIVSYVSNGSDTGFLSITHAGGNAISLDEGGSAIFIKSTYGTEKWICCGIWSNAAA